MDCFQVVEILSTILTALSFWTLLDAAEKSPPKELSGPLEIYTPQQQGTAQPTGEPPSKDESNEPIFDRFLVTETLVLFLSQGDFGVSGANRSRAVSRVLFFLLF
jgi:hypothetical protein